jgi:hypothetical protein
MTEIQIKPKRKKRSTSKCRVKTQNGDACNGKYRLEHEGAIPLFICDICGDQELTWKKFYTEYLQLWKDKANWSEKRNTVSCILGFFCYMYKEFFVTDYIFVPQNPNPYGAKEVKDSWTLMSAFQNDIEEVRKYIYWVFKKGVNKNVTITNFGYINTPGLIRKYKLYAERRKTFTRDSELPWQFLDWCKECVPEIFNKYALATMNDLGALLAYTREYETELQSQSTEVRTVVAATRYNLIKDGKLNIRG